MNEEKQIEQNLVAINTGNASPLRIIEYGNYLLYKWDQSNLWTITLSKEGKKEQKELHSSLAFTKYTALDVALKAIDKLHGGKHAQEWEVIYDSKGELFHPVRKPPRQNNAEVLEAAGVDVEKELPKNKKKGVIENDI